jgi:putative oxidoreductase
MKLHPNLALLVARLAIGAVFIHAGLYKFLSSDVGGYRAFVAMGEKTIPPYVPHAIGVAYVHVVPLAEVLIGALIAVGLLTRISAAIMTLMLISFMMAATGFFDRGGPHSSLVFACVALAIALAGPGCYSLDALLRRSRSAA